jgi:hypothetical protein
MAELLRNPDRGTTEATDRQGRIDGHRIVTEAEAKTVLQDVVMRYQRNPYHLLRDAAHIGERINGQVPGPTTGTLYPIIIATEWADAATGDIRVTVVVHDKGANRFGYVAADFVKSPDPASS